MQEIILALRLTEWVEAGVEPDNGQHPARKGKSSPTIAPPKWGSPHHLRISYHSLHPHVNPPVRQKPSTHLFKSIPESIHNPLRKSISQLNPQRNPHNPWNTALPTNRIIQKHLQRTATSVRPAPTNLLYQLQPQRLHTIPHQSNISRESPSGVKTSGPKNSLKP